MRRDRLDDSKTGSVRILAISPFLLGDVSTSGGVVGARGFLKGVAERHEVHLIVLDSCQDPTSSADAVNDMRCWATSVRSVKLPVTLLLRTKAKLRQMLLIPNGVTRASSQLMRAACQELLAERQIDVALILFPQMAQYVEEFPDIPTIMDVQDAYSVSGFRNYAAADSQTLLKRFSALRDWFSWLRHERKYYKLFDHLLVVSEQDSYGLRLFNPNLKITVLPRMLSLDASTPLSGIASYHIGFIGSFLHKPNTLALAFLFERIIPELLTRIPDLRVLVAGRDPQEDLMKRAPACVKFAGFVPKVEDFYSQIAIVVAPLTSGGGIKIKVIEGLLAGRPVVTTSIGAEGIGLTSGMDALIADDPVEFAAAVAKLIHDPQIGDAIGSAGRKHALQINDMEVQSNLIDQVLASIREAS